MRIHCVAMLQAFVHFPVHPLASWVRHLDQQRRQNHRLSILPDGRKLEYRVKLITLKRPCMTLQTPKFSSKFSFKKAQNQRTKFRCLQGLCWAFLELNLGLIYFETALETSCSNLNLILKRPFNQLHAAPAVSVKLATLKRPYIDPADS